MNQYFEYTPDIVRLNIDNYNDTNEFKRLMFKTNSRKTIVQNTNDYHVTLEKMEIPINGKEMFINTDTNLHTICIFNDNKPEDLVIPGLAYGPNYFQFGGPIKSVQEFLDKLNDYTLKSTLPLTLGQFVTEKVGDETKIVFIYDKEDSLSFSTLELYLSKRLELLLGFDMDYTNVIDYNGIKLTKLNIVTDFTLTPPGPVKIYQENSTYLKFFTLKSIRVYTNLPIDPYFIYENRDNSSNPSNLLCETVFDTLSMFEISNYLYIPNVFRYSSMVQANDINSFELYFKYKYANGTEIDVFQDPFDYASVTLAFIKKSF